MTINRKNFIRASAGSIGAALFLPQVTGYSKTTSSEKKSLELKYYVLDVFTNQRYKGNQLSVVHCPEELTLEQYHEISREFDYSETSFINYSAKENALVVRSFTPAEFEVVGAGHNLLGAVCFTLIKGWDIFKNQKGENFVIIKNTKIPLKITQENGQPYVAMKQRPVKLLSEVPAEPIAEAIGLTNGDLILNDWKIRVAETEVAHLMVPIKDVQALTKAVANKKLLNAASKKYGFEGCYLFTTNTTNKEILAETRFFNPGIGIDEDPATGTAAGPLSGYLHHLGYIQQNKNYTLLQGAAIKHPSFIRINVSQEGVWVSGSSTIVMEGTLYL